MPDPEVGVGKGEEYSQCGCVKNHNKKCNCGARQKPSGKTCNTKITEGEEKGVFCQRPPLAKGVLYTPRSLKPQCPWQRGSLAKEELEGGHKGRCKEGCDLFM